MALRVGLGDYFFGLQLKFGNSMCITDDSILLTTILDPKTEEYDGYAVLQRETGTLAAEFRFNRRTGGRPGSAAVKAVVFKGEVARDNTFVELQINDEKITVGPLLEGLSPTDTAQRVFAELVALGFNEEYSDTSPVTVELQLDTLTFISRTVGRDFRLDVGTTDIEDVEPQVTTALVQPAGPDTIVSVMQDVVSGSVALPVTDVSGFAPGQTVYVGDYSQRENPESYRQYVVQAVGDADSVIFLTEPLTQDVLSDWSVWYINPIVVASVAGLSVGDSVFLKDTEEEVVKIKSIHAGRREIYPLTSLVREYGVGSTVESLKTRPIGLSGEVIALIENEEAFDDNTPETDVICFDYNRADNRIYCFRRDRKQLLTLDPYNARTKPVGLPDFTSIAGQILDIHIMNEEIYILNSVNTIYKYSLATGSLLTKINIHRNHKVSSITGAQYRLDDRFEDQGLLINCLYLLCENNTVLVYDLVLARVVLSTSVTSDADVKAIDFYRTYQAAPPDEGQSDWLIDQTGGESEDPSDAAFLFSLASGLSNGEFVNRWQYNLFKFVPTTIVMVSTNAVIVPGKVITILARGLSDRGEVVNDLPIKFNVAGNAGGTVTPEVFTFSSMRDGWVPAVYKAAENPPLGSSDTITAVIVT